MNPSLKFRQNVVCVFVHSLCKGSHAITREWCDKLAKAAPDEVFQGQGKIMAYVKKHGDIEAARIKAGEAKPTATTAPATVAPSRTVAASKQSFLAQPSAPASEAAFVRFDEKPTKPARAR